MKKLDNNNCPNCGAPITTEICPYCNIATGLDTMSADMEYPVIECKEASIGFWSVMFPMIFALSFGFGGLCMPIILFLEEGFNLSLFLFFIPFAVVGIVSAIIAIKPIIRFFSIKVYGKDIYAIVYGYMDDNVLLNGRPAQMVKLLVDTNDGKKFILYQLGDIKQPFKINSQINLKVYKDIFLIVNKKQYYF